MTHSYTPVWPDGSLMVGDAASPGPIKIMLVGDSQTVGNGFAGDSATAYREAFWVALRNQRARFSLMGNTAGVFRTGVDSMLGDGVYAATAGQTVAAADAQAAATEAIYGPADAYVVLAGTNDTAAGSTASQIIAALVTLVQNRLVANLSAHVFVLTLCPWVSPASSYAAHDTVRLAVNAGLPAAMAAISPRVHVVEAGGLLTAAHMDSSGNHPNGLGYRLIGQAAADAVAASMGRFGSTTPRALMRRTAVPCLAVTSNIGQSASIAATSGLTPTGHASFSCGFLWRPTVNSHAFQTRLMTAMGASFVANDWWGFDWVQTTNVLECWVGGYQGGTQALQASGIVKVNTWHAIMMSADASNNLVQMWCMRAGSDGKPQSMLAGAKLMPAWNLTSYNTFFGADAVLNGCEGLYSRFWLANGYVANADDAEGWYYDQAMPRGVTAYYSLEEGTGTSLAPALGETTLPNGSMASTSWSAAGAVPTPWDL